MTQVKDNISSPTGKHLTYEERIKIEAFKKNKATLIVQLHG